MAAPFNPSLVAPLGFGALILWRSYSRMRRLIGRQRLSKVRPWITVSVFPVLTVLLVTASIGKPTSLLALAAGVAVGLCLGLYGLRVTRFEKTPEGLFYTPSAHVGIALSLLFLGRILYRFVQIYALGASAGVSPGEGSHIGYATTPITLLIFGTLAGYYVTYAVGLLRWQRGQ